MIEGLNLAGFMAHLKEGRFSSIFEGQELERFNAEINAKAIPAGGFVIGCAVPEGGMYWLLFRFDRESEPGVLKTHSPELVNGGITTTNIPPETYNGYPVEWFSVQLVK